MKAYLAQGMVFLDKDIAIILSDHPSPEDVYIDNNQPTVKAKLLTDYLNVECDEDFKRITMYIHLNAKIFDEEYIPVVFTFDYETEFDAPEEETGWKGGTIVNVSNIEVKNANFIFENLSMQLQEKIIKTIEECVLESIND